MNKHTHWSGHISATELYCFVMYCLFLIAVTIQITHEWHQVNVCQTVSCNHLGKKDGCLLGWVWGLAWICGCLWWLSCPEKDVLWLLMLLAWDGCCLLGRIAVCSMRLLPGWERWALVGGVYLLAGISCYFAWDFGDVTDQSEHSSSNRWHALQDWVLTIISHFLSQWSSSGIWYLFFKWI